MPSRRRCWGTCGTSSSATRRSSSVRKTRRQCAASASFTSLKAASTAAPHITASWRYVRDLSPHPPSSGLVNFASQRWSLLLPRSVGSVFPRQWLSRVPRPHFTAVHSSPRGLVARCLPISDLLGLPFDDVRLPLLLSTLFLGVCHRASFIHALSTSFCCQLISSFNSFIFLLSS